jgi:epidermal growth factor receptor substrate 15
LAGQDVPSELPPSLMPPSARISALGTSPFPPANAQNHQDLEPGTDLFSFDDTPPSSAFSQQPPNNFGGVLKQPTGSTSNAFSSSKPNDPFSSSYQTCVSDIFLLKLNIFIHAPL